MNFIFIVWMLINILGLVFIIHHVFTVERENVIATVLCPMYSIIDSFAYAVDLNTTGKWVAMIICSAIMIIALAIYYAILIAFALVLSILILFCWLFRKRKK